MPTQVWRPGDYRVCPQCLTRHKVQDLRCTHCKTVLAGVRVRHAAAPTVVASAARPGRGLRAVIAVAVVLALAAGLWVRSLFRGAALQDSVEASSVSPAPAPAAATDPGWTPPDLSYPSTVGTTSGVPASLASLTIQASPLPAYAPSAYVPATTGTVSYAPAPAPVDSTAPATGMTSIAPPSEPTRKTTFTNDDLSHVRSEPPVAVPAAVSSVPAPTGASPAGSIAAAIASSRVVASAADEDVRKWTSKLRDREDDVRDAQSKVRRLEAEAAVKRAQAAAIGDAGARDKAQRDVQDALDDLEKAERKLSEKQRNLDEAKTDARAAGVRLE